MQPIVYAAKKHSSQMYGDVPYLVHLMHVSQILISYSYTDYTTQVAAILHDVLEDTDATRAELEKIFDWEIATRVWACSDEEGRNRKERKAKVYEKLASYPNAIVIKLADRIANVESCILNKNERLYRMYKKEYPEFKEKLQSHSRSHNDLWNYLDYLME